MSRDRSKDYLTARKGDHIGVSFECDLCVFRKLRKHEPSEQALQDRDLLRCIRRVNLDAFWSRASSTVRSNVSQVVRMLDTSELLGLTGPFLDPGPLPDFDHCGYEVAILMVLISLREGLYHESHLQWETIRKIRTAFSNQVRAAALTNGAGLVLADNMGKSYARIGTDPCGSLWFSQFLLGCRKRMGQDWRPDQAITPELVKAILDRLFNQVLRSKDRQLKTTLLLAGCYFVVCYVIALRGPEGLLLDLGGLRRYLDKYKEELTVIVLYGQVKGEHQEREHLLPAANKTDSGIPVRLWIEYAIRASEKMGRTTGPLMMKTKSAPIKSSDLNGILHESLIEIYADKPELFPNAIKSVEDIEEKYSVFRSFRRGSDTRAAEVKVAQPDVYIVNRWKKKEASDGRKPGMPISQIYVDLDMLKQPFLRYTRAM